jgi:Fe-S cluster assembly protein SufD
LEEHYLSLPARSERVKAWERFCALGLPQRHQEAFHYVPLGRLYQERFSLAPATCLQAQAQNAGVLLALEEAQSAYGTFLQNRRAKSEQEESDPFVWLNAALSQEGMFLYVPPGSSSTDWIVIDCRSAGLCMPRLHVVVGKGAQAHVLLRAQTEKWCNSVVDVALEDGARLTLVSHVAAPGWHFEALRATLKGRSALRSYVLSAGAGTVRCSYKTSLLGEGAEADMHGLYRLQGSAQAHTHGIVEHRAPRCRSMQLFKSVVGGTAQTSFAGKICVGKEAHGADAYQRNNNLILSPHAQAHSKPGLEIFADDVKASHGATFGRLPEDQLFYLRTRGIPQGQARALLIDAFCRDVTSSLPVEWHGQLV